MSLDLRKPLVLDDSGNTKEFDQESQILLGSGFVPLFIDQGETWVLPQNRQAVASIVPDVDGVMQLDGVLDDLSTAN